jgi:large-conductance mechanosensitive channel
VIYFKTKTERVWEFFVYFHEWCKQKNVSGLKLSKIIAVADANIVALIVGEIINKLISQ